MVYFASFNKVFLRYISEATGRFFFFKLVFTPCKAEQPLRGMELQEKEAQKGYSI